MAEKRSDKGGKGPRDEVRGGRPNGKGGQKNTGKSGAGQKSPSGAKFSSGQRSAPKPSSGTKPQSEQRSAQKSSSGVKSSSGQRPAPKPNSSSSRQRTSSTAGAKTGGRPGSAKGSASKGKKKNAERNKVLEASVKLFLVLILIILIVTMWRNRVDWSCVNIAQCAQDTPQMVGIGDGFPVSVLGSSVLAEDELAGGIAVLTDTATTVYNTSSKQVMSRAHYLGNPAMKTAGRYGLLIDIGGTKYQLESVADTLASGATDMPIIGCAVSRSGSFAIITQGSSYSSSKLSTVEVFDRSGEPLHIWHSGSYYITEAALSADGKYLAMAGLSARDGSLCSSIILHKVGKEGNLCEIALADTVCLSLEYTNTGSLYAVCSNRLIYIDDNGETNEQYSFSGELQSYDISYAAGAAVYTSGSSDSESGRLTVLDTRGQVRWERDLPLHSLAVSLGEGGCCVLGRGGMMAYSLAGDKLGEWEAAVSAADVLVLGSRAYVIEGISVSQINLNSGGDED